MTEPLLSQLSARELDRALDRAGIPIAPDLRPAIKDWDRRIHEHKNDRQAIPYRTALQIAADTPDQPAWLARGYVALQAITEIDGKIKSSGKTTLVTHLAAAVLDGVPFLGQPRLYPKRSRCAIAARAGHRRPR